MSMRSDRAKAAILKALDEIGEAGASRITARLAAMGVNLQPRTVRFYLLRMDKQGLTRFMSRRRGRVITDRGREELQHANVMQKVGFVAARIDTLSYSMSFDRRAGEGSLITNTVLVKNRDFGRSLHNMEPVFAAGLGMGNRVAVAMEGQTLGGAQVPRGQVAIATVCSMSVNGILLKEGIPAASRFGGLLEMRKGKPLRFVQLMEYRGSTADPLELFIRAGMTEVRQCAETGSGIIGASFREVPGVASAEVRSIRNRLASLGLGGILTVGEPNRPLLGVPVAEGKAGMIVAGGLNPVAALHEAGVPVVIDSLSGFEDYGTFVPFAEIATMGRRRIPYVE